MLTVITPATVEPVSVDVAREHLRIIHTEFDSEIARAVSAAREYVERETGVALAEATYRWEREADEPMPLLPAVVSEDGPVVTFTTAPGHVPEQLRAAILLRVKAELDADPDEAVKLRDAARNLAHLYRRNLGV